MSSLARVCAPIVLALAASAQDPFEKDRAALLEGVRTTGAPGLPGAMVAYGKDAFAVVAGKWNGAQAAVVAAGRAGSGRVVGLTHNGYANRGSAESEDTGRLLVNALRWAAGAAGKVALGPRVLVWSSDLAPWLKEQGLRATPQPGALGQARLADFDVLLLGAPELPDSDVQALAKYLRAGGGIVAAQTAWGWQQLSHAPTMQENALNRVFAAAGLVWTNAITERTDAKGYDARARPHPLLHALAALEAISSDTVPDEAERRQADRTLQLVLPALPADDPWLAPRVAALLERHQAELVATPAAPLTEAQPLARFLARLQVDALARARPLEVRAHPAAASFPGSVPAGATPVTRKLAIDLAVPGWQSTGLYAPPGAVITVDLAREQLGRRLALRIGCHQDELYGHARWSRMPEITSTVALSQATTQVASAFGGPIYVVVPDGLPAGEAQVLVRGALEAPLFVRGRTPLEEWRKTIRARPAPWAELASSKIVLSVPSEHVRALEDPEALMAFWDRIADAMADLAGRPRTRLRPERFVADVQISAGYMHSGYPIMTHLDAAPRMVDLAELQRGEWGLLHELGHNHQEGPWTFDGTGEVTNNVFVLYVLETVCGRESGLGHDALREGPHKLAAHVAAGATFEGWRADPFLALHMYRQLIGLLGWDAYKQVLAGYRADPAERLPKDDEQKRDQWLLRCSRAAGRNLAPFFRAWGVPVSDAACAEVSGLPGWMPDDFPAK